MVDAADKKPGAFRAVRRYILIGLLTAAPLAITFLILEFLFTLLADIGEPWIRGLARGVRQQNPALADLMVNEVLMSITASLIVLLVLLLLGWATGRVVGQRLIRLFEQLISAIPFVDSVYHATKRFGVRRQFLAGRRAWRRADRLSIARHEGHRHPDPHPARFGYG